MIMKIFTRLARTNTITLNLTNIFKSLIPSGVTEFTIINQCFLTW